MPSASWPRSRSPRISSIRTSCRCTILERRKRIASTFPRERVRPPRAWNSLPGIPAPQVVVDHSFSGGASTGGASFFAIALVTTGDYLSYMKAVGVKKLMAKLSEYLRAVRAGETLLVTDGDEVIAEIRPVSGRLPPRNDLEEVLEGLAESGELQRARTRKSDWAWHTSGLGLEEGSAARLLEELRGDWSPPDG